MADIKVSGRMKVKSFYNAFIKQFPYLHASLRLPDGKGADMQKSIANARFISKGGKYSPTGKSDLSIRGNLNIGTFEKRFEKALGIKCEVHYLRENGKWYKTGKRYDGYTLSEASTRLEKDGMKKIGNIEKYN